MPARFVILESMSAFARRALFALIAALGAPALAAPWSAIDVLDPRDFDTAVSACEDFNQHANGGWIKNTPVPFGRDSFGARDEIEMRVWQQRLGLLETPRGASTNSLEAALAALTNAGLDEAHLIDGRAAILQPLLAPIDELRRTTEVGALIEQYQLRALPLLWRFDVIADEKGQGLLQISPRAMALADPAYYLSEAPAARDLLSRYRGYAQALFAAMGSTDVETESAWLLDGESRFARALAGAATANELSLRELGKRYPAIAWKSLLKTLGVKNARRVRIAHPLFLAELQSQLKSAPLPLWRSYLRFHLAHALAPWLDAVFFDAHDAFFRGALRGETSAWPRAERVLAAVELALPEAVTQRYAERHLGAADRERSEALFEGLRSQFDQRLQRTVWLGERSRKLLRDRLATMRVVFAGDQAPWPLAGLKLQGSFAAQMLAVARYRQQQRLLHVGGSLPAPTPGPIRPVFKIRSSENALEIHPAALQSFLFAATADPAVRYGALGSQLARELLRALGIGGSDAGAVTAATFGWSEPERAAYQQHVAALAHSAAVQLAAPSAEAALTLASELSSDLAALQLALAALEADPQATATPLIGGLNPYQRFFHAYARSHRENLATNEASTALQANLRIDGLLPHTSRFTTAFQCQPGSRLLRPIAERLELWR